MSLGKNYYDSTIDEGTEQQQQSPKLGLLPTTTTDSDLKVFTFQSHGDRMMWSRNKKLLAVLVTLLATCFLILAVVGIIIIVYNSRAVRTGCILDIQGHRGCRGLLPENTIPAYLKAVDLGVETLEMDTVISKDMQVLMSHDPFLNPQFCTDPNGQIIPSESTAMKNFNLFHMDYSEIAKCDCGGRGNPAFPEQQKMNVSKPLLSHMFDEVEAYIKKHNKKRVWYNIETKTRPDRDNIFTPPPEEFVKLLYNVIKEKNMLKRVTIQSFDVRTLQIMKKLNPSIPLVLLVDHNSATVPFDFHQRLNELGFLPHTYSPHYKLITDDMIKYIKDNKVKLIPWTVNTREEMQGLVDRGVDGIISDYPNIAVQFRKCKGG